MGKSAAKGSGAPGESSVLKIPGVSTDGLSRVSGNSTFPLQLLD